MLRSIFGCLSAIALLAALAGSPVPAVAQEDVTCNPVLDSRGDPVSKSAGGVVRHAGSFPCPPEEEVVAVVEEEVVVPERRQVFDVFFDFDSAELSPEDMDRLAEVAETVRTYDNPVVTVLGNADQVGATDYNVALSERRANAVAEQLAARGIEVDAVIGRGDQAPSVDNPDRRPEEMNRRAFIVVREEAN